MYKIFTVLMFFSACSIAESYKIKVCGVQASPKHDTVHLQPCQTWMSKSSCPNNGYLEWDASKFQGQAMYSTALTAFVSGNFVLVNLVADDCGSFDRVSFLRIIKTN